MKKHFFSLSQPEKVFLGVFLTVLFLSGFALLGLFYRENTEIRPAQGGEFIEGMVGGSSLRYNFNPLFAEEIEADATNLMFAGLMRFNAETGEIEDYLATHTLSSDKTVYEFTIRDGAMWHDGQPVTASDILFTFHDVIQNENFPGQLLKKAFEGVLIERIDEKTVRFTTPEKRKTFFTNFTIGLLPRHILADVPVQELMNDPFNQNPIGCGPYRFEGIVSETDYVSLRFSAFPEYFDGPPYIQTIFFRIFPSNEKLIAYLSELDAVRPMQTREMNIFPHDIRFTETQVISPQYLAVFFNLKDDALITKNIRKAMRAATNTTALAKEFFGERVDTPLVELWPQNNIVNISKQRAEELLTESGYLYPEQRPSDEKEENIPQEISPPPVPVKNRFISEPSPLPTFVMGITESYIVGSFPEETSAVKVNNYTLSLFNPKSGRFTYKVSTKIGTMKSGENIYTVQFLNSSGDVIDTERVTIILEIDPEKRAAREKENQASKAEVKPAEEKTPPEETVHPKAEGVTPKQQEGTEENGIRFRENASGERIHLNFIYLDSFEYLGEIAQKIQKSWEDIGIQISLEALPPYEFRERIKNRDYNLLLLPEHMGYNLDPYPYFHLSQVGESGLNLSNWKNLKASLLMEDIRTTHDSEKRLDSILQLRDIIIDDVPAIFLFTPKYSWLYDSKVKSVHIKNLAILADRYSRIHEFYIREKRAFPEEKHISDFFSWFIKHTKTTFSFSPQE